MSEITGDAVKASAVQDNPMRFFSENVDKWGAAEWFDRLASAIRAQDKAVQDKFQAGDEDECIHEARFETFRSIAASSAMTLVRGYEDVVRAALSPPVEQAPHPVTQETRLVARPLTDWHEDYGFVTWWKFPVSEPSYIGSPLCSDWPGYHTHWTPHPEIPANADALSTKEPTE